MTDATRTASILRQHALLADRGLDGDFVAAADLIDSQQRQIETLREALADVAVMLKTPDAYLPEYIAAVCGAALANTAEANRQAGRARMKTTEELKAELQHLTAENARAVSWGAAVGARSERIAGIERELGRRAKPGEQND